jgi:hypothetical protein
LPHIDVLFDQLVGAKVFSKIYTFARATIRSRSGPAIFRRRLSLPDMGFMSIW